MRRNNEKMERKVKGFNLKTTTKKETKQKILLKRKLFKEKVYICENNGCFNDGMVAGDEQLKVQEL